ncbi:site-2 protease family protein [Glaciihabitans sp. dw_435]|uniref:M50 family metallopeptidase n=1 Tax=Glaciihabitans sp. dw_435 TaxID=2720081 RepID=UPI001BD1E96D|nr:site-2 protease family protein [Glaciihabitans sp. dw_435]
METVLLYILGILVVVVGLAVSIGLHEIGHLIPAKLFGVRVGQYMIGFGPTLFSRKFGETEYGFKAIPMGGYISMSGMYPPAKKGGKARTASTGFFQTLVQDDAKLAEDYKSTVATLTTPDLTDEPRSGSVLSTMVSDARDASAATVVEGEEHRTFYNLPIWKRVIIMLGGPTMNLLIGLVLYAVLLCGFGTAQLSTTVGSVSACVIASTSSQTECAADDPAAPGAAAGLKPGDKLFSMNGTAITTWAQATSIIRDSAGEPLTIVVERDGADVTLTATPLLTDRVSYDSNNKVIEDSSGKAITSKVGFLGIGPASEIVQQPVSAVLPAVGNNIGSVVHLIVNLPSRLVDIVNAAFGPGERDPNGPISVVGVGRIAGEITSLNTIPVVERISALIGLIASLNIALFVFNLVPLMPLDGGHVAGALWEGIRRFFAKIFKRRDPGPVDTAKMVPITFVVVILLGSMSLLLVYADIVKPVSIF